MSPIRCVPIGKIHSPLKTRAEAPRFYTEGAPDAFLEVYRPYRPALYRMQVGQEIIVLTWLHRSPRTVLRVHPRAIPGRPLRGVFTTRSPDRPNPIGLHRCTVRSRRTDGLRIGPIEAIDGTPVLDIKCVVDAANDA